MRRFTIKYPDDSISIVVVPEGIALTNAEIIAKSPKYQTGVSNRDIINDDIPVSINPEYERFREAYTDDGTGEVKIDMVKAKEVILEQLRQVRNVKLDDLDRLEFKANGTSDNQLAASVQQDKQTLRQATNGLKAISVSGYNNYTVLDDLIAAAVLPATNN